MKFEKPGPNKKSNKRKTKQETEWFVFIVHHGCMVCGQTPEIHHIRIYGEQRDHLKSIPLCPEHHRGNDGIHGLGKKEWRKRYGHELEMLKKLQEIFCT
jgi:predicted class III extradiol MEMO1 family dioxygenase